MTDAQINLMMDQAAPEQWERLLSVVLGDREIDPDDHGDKLAVMERPDRFEME